MLPNCYVFLLGLACLFEWRTKLSLKLQTVAIIWINETCHPEVLRALIFFVCLFFIDQTLPSKLWQFCLLFSIPCLFDLCLFLLSSLMCILCSTGVPVWSLFITRTKCQQAPVYFSLLLVFVSFSLSLCAKYSFRFTPCLAWVALCVCVCVLFGIHHKSLCQQNKHFNGY